MYNSFQIKGADVVLCFSLITSLLQTIVEVMQYKLCSLCHPEAGFLWVWDDVTNYKTSHGLLWPHLQTSFRPPFALVSISAWMIFKKWGVQLFTWLFCNSEKLIEKKIWKLVLGCLRVFHSACNKFQEVRQLQLHISTTGDSWSSTWTPEIRLETNDWTGNSQWALSSHSRSAAFLQHQHILGH